jgi:hypothetical protein
MLFTLTRGDLMLYLKTKASLEKREKSSLTFLNNLFLVNELAETF